MLLIEIQRKLAAEGREIGSDRACKKRGLATASLGGSKFGEQAQYTELAGDEAFPTHVLRHATGHEER